jgi:N-acetylglucosamine-6-phosphate deacetylase
MRHAVTALRRHRMTAIFFTLITDSVDALCRKLECIEKLRTQDESIAATVRGYHLEGPWISTEPGYHGAHPKEHACEPSLEDYRRLRDAAGGNLKLITLAPEVEGCELIMEAARTDGIRIGLGHTNASEAAIDRAIRAGATLAIHVGNAVPLHLHRHDNVVQRLLARDELIACLIPDGIHLPPFVLQNYFRAKSSRNVIFTTDCMAAAGAPPGTYTVGPHEMEVGSDGIVHLPGDSRFAGSSLTLDKGVENIVKWLALDRAEAVALCSTVPAKHFGIEL